MESNRPFTNGSAPFDPHSAGAYLRSRWPFLRNGESGRSYKLHHSITDMGWLILLGPHNRQLHLRRNLSIGYGIAWCWFWYLWSTNTALFPELFFFLFFIYLYTWYIAGWTW